MESIKIEMKTVYIIGALRNDRIPEVGAAIRSLGLEAFNDWHSAGPDADDFLRDHYRSRGCSYKEGIYSHAAKHIFNFDKYHLDRSHAGVLVMPAGKSAHLEMGYLIGQGKPVFILFDKEPERFEVMHNFATDIFFDLNELKQTLKEIV